MSDPEFRTQDFGRGQVGVQAQDRDQNAQDRDRFVARGIAHLTLPVTVQAPIAVSFVLMADFTMLAFTSAIEPLRVANQLTGQILFTWHVYSENGQPVACSNGVPVMTDGPLPETSRPGYILLCGGVEPERACTPALTHWIRKQWRLGRTVGGLCTGAYALARAGILSGKRFTLHWENLTSFAEKYPDLTPERRIFCIEDRIVTCAGGVASADLAGLTQRFARHGGDGFGLGLHICQQIVSAAGGRLEIVSPAPSRTDGFVARVTLLPPPDREA